MKHRLLFTLLAVLLAAQAWATEVPGYGDIVLQYAWISTSGSSVNIDNEDQRWAQCDYYVWYNSAKSIAIIRYVNYQHWSSNATYTVPNSLSIGGKSHKVVGLWKLDNRQMILDNGKITTLNLPEGLEFIKGNEAINLANITSLTLPASLTWLSSSACKAPRVTTLTLKDSATPLTIDGWEGYTNGVFGYMPVATATVGRSLVSENRPFGCSDENMTLKTLTITGSMKTMMNDFCNGQRKLATVTIKEGVTNISNSAFRDCGKLTAITIPNSVKVIEEHAFRGDTLLNKVNLGAGVKYIRDYAFLDCRSVTALTLPASLDSIDDGAFYNMSGVKTLTIEDNSKELLIRGWTGYSIGAFGWFADGYTATVGRNFNLKAYGEAEANRPFGYSKVGKVTMTDYVTRLNSSEYYYCSLLKNVTLSPNIKEIPDNTFQNDTLLTGIAIPDKVTHIGLRAFQNDSMMTTLTMSKGVKYIRDYAFDNCFRVPSLVLPASLDSIDDGAFYNMRGVRTLTIEDNSK
ncbi:MAG: leucine-rich repeat protein, partial [Muribaculaceae bacterium]|nr:leucine-rich repeat protein [Muribaculaceae bacterium]